MNAIGANTWIWVSPPTDARLAELVPRIAAWGFDVVEIAVEEPGQWDPSRTRQLLDDHGLGATVCAVTPEGRDLTVEDQQVVRSTQEYLRACIDAAATLGSHVVGGPMYAPVGRTWRQTPDERQAMLDRLSAALRPVADHAADAGVVLGVEPLNRFETSVINTTAQGLELVELVDSPACGLMLDTFHLNIEEQDVAAAIRSAGPHLMHLQVCANDRGAPGADHLDWPRIVAAVEEIGYDGPVCIESFTAENETIATAAAIWRPLARSQDAIAVDGLAFLRSVLGVRTDA